MKFQGLRGFRDYLPADAAARREVLDKVRETVRRFGFQEVDTPSVETLELFKAKSGPEIVAQTFSFTDKGGREVTLVPENTPSLARLFVERAKIEPLPVKWVGYPRLWRYEEPQSGRLREFAQVSLDIFGVPGPDAELELLLTSQAVMDAIGLAGRYLFRLNDRRLANGMGRALGVQDPGPFFRALDRRDKLPTAEFRGELERAGLNAGAVERLELLLQRCGRGVPAGEASAVLAELRGWQGMDEEGVAGLENIRRILEMAKGTGLEAILYVDPSLVRGLGYYTSTAFEAWAKEGEIRALYGGGRYDRLIELFGGPAVPACGLAMGDQTLELLLREAGRWPKEAPGLDVYVAVVDASLAPEARQWSLLLRAAGWAADYDLLGRALSKQMKEASRRSATWLVLLGPREQAQGQVTLRNMQSGQQDVVAAASLVERLRASGPGDARGAAPPSAAGGAKHP